MAKRNDKPIEVHAFVKIGEETVDVDTLTPEQRRELATGLKLKFLNTMFRGKAEFRVADEKERNESA